MVGEWNPIAPGSAITSREQDGVENQRLFYLCKTIFLATAILNLFISAS